MEATTTPISTESSTLDHAEGSAEQAVLAVKSATPSKVFVKQQVMLLKEMGFNQLEDAVLLTALADNDNNVDATIDDLLAASFVVEPGRDGKLIRKGTKKDQSAKEEKEFWQYKNSGLGVYNLSASSASAYKVKSGTSGGRGTATAQVGFEAGNSDTFAPLITGAGARV